MGKDLYEKHPVAKQFFEKANDILGFRISDIIFEGTDEELKQTAAAGADFALYGHTHDGQVWPLTLVTNAIYRQPYGYGLWGKMQAYVSSGLGLWGPPFRIGTRSEMVIIDFCFQ